MALEASAAELVSSLDPWITVDNFEGKNMETLPLGAVKKRGNRLGMFRVLYVYKLFRVFIASNLPGKVTPNGGDC